MEKKIEMAGRAYRLCYSVNALCELEDRIGGPVENITDRLFSGTRLLLWAGLTELQPQIMLQETGRLMDEYLANGGKLDDLAEVCAAALECAGFLHDARADE